MRSSSRNSHLVGVSRTLGYYWDNPAPFRQTAGVDVDVEFARSVRYKNAPIGDSRMHRNAELYLLRDNDVDYGPDIKADRQMVRSGSAVLLDRLETVYGKVGGV